MSARIEIRTLGALEILLDDRPVQLPAKVQALLVYLALTGRAHSRSALAGLLWGDMPEERARANLRLALTALRSGLGDVLQANRATVGLAPKACVACDAVKLTQLAGQPVPDIAPAKAALDAYRGDFLAGFDPGDTPEFEEWMLAERERLRQLSLELGHCLADRLVADQQLDDARVVLQRSVEIAPWNEAAHRRLIEVYARMGERSLALTQYERCRAILAAEFGVEPDAETQALLARLRTPDAPDSPPIAAPPDVTDQRINGPQPRRTAPPAPLTSFIGREHELAQLDDLLRPRETRLVTLHGPGGSGKTRLALAALERYGGRYPDGAAFVAFTGAAPSRPGEAEDLLVNGIAAALGYTFEAQQPPHELLAGHLSDRALLLALDNLETLVAGSSLLVWLLERAPGLSMLVTSRERLGVAGERVVTLAGLEVPPIGEAADPLAYPACRLFAERAREVQPEVDIAAAGSAMARICRSVDGHPLAIELAASWARALSIDEIAARVEHDQAVLRSDAPGIAARHRSIRAVCEQTYELLSDESRRVLARLSVFRGGWTLAAAEAVAGCGLAQLGVLIDRSLVRRDAGGRFDLHELVRQFAAEKLAADPEEHRRMRAAHAAYFTAFLQQRHDATEIVSDPRIVAQIDRETDNVRAAWELLVERGDTRQAAQLIAGYWPFLSNRGRYQEAVSLLLQALALPGVSPLQRARWRRWVAQALYQMGEVAEAVDQLAIMLQPLGYRVASGNANWPKMLRSAARQAFNRLRAAAPAAGAGDARELALEGARALDLLGQAIYMQGDAVGALRAALQALNYAERAGHHAEIAHSFGIVALTLAGVPAKRLARRYFERANAMLADIEDPLTSARTLEALGVYCVSNGEWDLAGPCVDEAEQIFDRLQVRRQRDESTALRALVAYWKGDLALAAQHWRTCALSSEHRGDPMAICWGRAGLVEVELRRGKLSPENLLGELERIRQPGGLAAAEFIRLHGARARCLALTGQPDAALAEARRGLERVAGITRPVAYALPGYDLVHEALVDLEMSEAAQAREGLETIARHLRLFARIFPIAEPAHHRARGYLERRAGRERAARAAWQAGLAAAERLRMPYEQARAHLDLATVTTDELREEHLAAARRLLHQAGAEPAPHLNRGRHAAVPVGPAPGSG